MDEEVAEEEVALADDEVDGDQADEAELDDVDATDEDADAAELDEEEEVEEHLKDAVEGSLRLKRLLSRDADGKPNKKAKFAEPPLEVQEKVKLLLARWGLQGDSGVKHVMLNLPIEELQILSNFTPNKNDPRKTPAELVAMRVADIRERAMPGGMAIDVIGSFKFRWKLTPDVEKQLRTLSHKDLRYVVNKFDGTVAIEDLIAEAACEEVEEDTAFNAVPSGNGVKVMSRFNRLELIDPMADCAVFGDANLTFSLNLARHRAGLGHVGRVIATTFEEIETLRLRYKEIDQSVKSLEEHDAEVYHGVDCTRIAIDQRFKEIYGALGAVYYNFPHSGAIQGFFDSHPMVNWRHENLMRLFFRALRSFVKPGGFVKVSSNKGAVGVRYSYIVDSARENEFVHVETMPFLEWTLHRYGRSYGDRRDQYKRPDAVNNQSYNAQNANNDMVYCFRYEPSGKTIGRQTVRPPPTLQALRDCKDGPFAKLNTAGQKDKLAKELHKRFVAECTGTHVG